MFDFMATKSTLVLLSKIISKIFKILSIISNNIYNYRDTAFSTSKIYTYL